MAAVVRCNIHRSRSTVVEVSAETAVARQGKWWKSVYLRCYHHALGNQLLTCQNAFTSAVNNVFTIAIVFAPPLL